MEQYILYLYLKSVLKSINDVFKCSFNDMDMNKGNVCGIYIKGGEPSEYRDLASGNYINNTARIQFLLQGSDSTQSLFDVLDAVSKLKKALVISSNTVYNLSESDIENLNSKLSSTKYEGVKLFINLTRLLGEVDFKGKTSQSLPRYSLNLHTYYSVNVVEAENIEI